MIGVLSAQEYAVLAAVAVAVLWPLPGLVAVRRRYRLDRGRVPRRHLVALVLAPWRVRRDRRAALAAQAAAQGEYADAVAGYRAVVAQSHERRGPLLELLAVAQAGRLDQVLSGAPAEADPDGPLARLYLDLALAGADEARRDAVVRTVRQGISDLDVLLPEAPLPPEPVPGLPRRARAEAGRWYAARLADLDGLRALAVPPVRLLPTQPTAAEREPAAGVAIAS